MTEEDLKAITGERVYQLAAEDWGELRGLVDRLVAEVRRLQQDEKRMDWLEQQGNGDQWIARESTTGRGYRLHNSSRPGYATPREAIDAAISGIDGNDF